MSNENHGLPVVFTAYGDFKPLLKKNLFQTFDLFFMPNKPVGVPHHQMGVLGDRTFPDIGPPDIPRLKMKISKDVCYQVVKEGCFLRHPIKEGVKDLLYRADLLRRLNVYV